MPSEDQYFRPRNWARFQHYKDRNPSWIKIYNDLLTDYEFGSLTELQQLHLMKLWLLYSRVGRALPLCCKHLARHLGADARALSRSINALLSRNFIELCDESASIVLASCKQSASPETETETEVDKNPPIVPPEGDAKVSKTKRKRRRKGARDYDPEFLAWWQSYPRKDAKGDAFDAYWTMREGHSRETLQAGADYAAGKYAGKEEQFIPLPATFLRREDFLSAVEGNGTADDLPAWVETPEQAREYWENLEKGKEGRFDV